MIMKASENHEIVVRSSATMYRYAYKYAITRKASMHIKGNFTRRMHS